MLTKLALMEEARSWMLPGTEVVKYSIMHASENQALLSWQKLALMKLDRGCF